MPTRIAFQLHQKGVVGGRILRKGIDWLRLMMGLGSDERTERSGADGAERSGAKWDGATLPLGVRGKASEWKHSARG